MFHLARWTNLVCYEPALIRTGPGPRLDLTGMRGRTKLKQTARENIGPRWKLYYAFVMPICKVTGDTLLAPILMFPMVLKLMKELYREGIPPWKRKETRHLYEAAAADRATEGEKIRPTRPKPQMSGNGRSVS